MQPLLRRRCHASLRAIALRPSSFSLLQFTAYSTQPSKLIFRPFTVSSGSTTEHVTVPCGSNGSISLHVTRYTEPSSLPPPILIYLPPGPVLSEPLHSPVAASLATNIAATIVQINYRLGPEHKYPTAIHDVLFGFDWVKENLVGKRSVSAPGFNDFLFARLGVFGELIGGGLATMLALTECHTKGHRIAAAAINDPILDWLSPEAVANAILKDANVTKKTKKNAKTSIWQEMKHEKAMQEIIRARTTLFRKPVDWFDPFVSPVLFFRTAGVDVPKEYETGPLDEFHEISLLNQQDFIREQLRLSAINNIPQTSETDGQKLGEGDDLPKKPRKAARSFPNVGSGLTLPNLRITTGNSGMLYEQAAEFTHLVRRSMVKTDELRHIDPETSIMHAQDRALHLVRNPASGYWHQGWNSGLAEVARWFREVL